MNRSLSFNQLLYAFIAFIFLMIAVRLFYFEKRHCLFLAWNIFLAWIPYVLSNFFSAEQKGWRQRLLFGVWLLFWPNALYIVTDLIHLSDSSNVPVWYDALMIFSAAVVGLMMAFVSLYRLEIFITQKLSSFRATALMIAILFAGSFGVYLGRFFRFNSWDIVHDPLDLATSIFSQVLFPFRHIHTWSVTVLFTIIFTLLYYSFKNGLRVKV